MEKLRVASKAARDDAEREPGPQAATGRVPHMSPRGESGVIWRVRMERM